MLLVKGGHLASIICLPNVSIDDYFVYVLKQIFQNIVFVYAVIFGCIVAILLLHFDRVRLLDLMPWISWHYYRHNPDVSMKNI